MAAESFNERSIIGRSAAAVGRSVGRWRRRRIAAAQDAYVEAWQTAWTEGCAAAWAGQLVTSRPYRRGPQSDAWTAGWNWAQTQCDRRDPSRVDANNSAARWRSAERRRRHLVNAAKGGALGLTIFAVVRWFVRDRSN
jgi:hypothetical protein